MGRLKGDEPSAGLPDIFEIVEVAYQSIIDPERFADLLDAWDAQINGGVFGIGSNAAAVLERHVEKLFPILERSLDLMVTEDDMWRFVDGEPRPALVLSTNGAVVRANIGSTEKLGLSEGGWITSDDLNADDAQSFKGYLTLAREGKIVDEILIICLVLPNDRTCQLGLRCVRPNDGDDFYILASAIEISIAGASDKLLRQSFKLSNAEIEIVRLMLEGMKGPEIAAKRGTGKETAKAQMKSIRRKTGAANTTELVCLMASLSAFSDQAARNLLGAPAPGRRAYQRPSHHRVVEIGGKVTEYLQVGPDDGKALVMMHASLVSFSWPQAILSTLRENGYTLYFPVRPGYGVSSPIVSDFYIEAVGEQIAGFIAAMGFERCLIGAHAMSTPYAVSSALRSRGVAKHLICLGGYLPIGGANMISKTSTWQRAFLYTARNFPTLVDFFALNGQKMALQLGPKKFYERIFGQSAADMAVIADPELLAHMQISFNLVQAQGMGAFVKDCQTIYTNWKKMFERLEIPITVIHGTHDAIFRIEDVKRFCADRPDIVLHEITSAGQLMHYSEPELVAKYILKAGESVFAE